MKTKVIKTFIILFNIYSLLVLFNVKKVQCKFIVLLKNYFINKHKIVFKHKKLKIFFSENFDGFNFSTKRLKYIYVTKF